MLEPVSRVSGNIVDVIGREIYSGTLEIVGGKITRIIREKQKYPAYIIPGFVDSHIHIESSMLTPSEFGRLAVTHGTIAAVCDPHEVANVMGVAGVRYMIKDAALVPFKFFWGAPSCVPATDKETSGARIGVKEVRSLLAMDEVACLSEVMNVPGVLQNDPDLWAKLNLARLSQKPIDGHAPGLGGEALAQYISSGISTDHEAYTREEALEKIQLGMKIQIREGSAARNLDELIPIAKQNADSCMFCSDDMHPDDLLAGHINLMVKRAIESGVDHMDTLRMASLNPIRHYRLDIGLLREGDPADFLVIDNFSSMTILKTVTNGMLVAHGGRTLIEESKKGIINNFNIREKSVHEFALKNRGGRVHVIAALDGQLVTNHMLEKPKVADGFLVSDTDRDLLKITVVNRYVDSPPAIGLVKNFGLKRGGIASSVAHDSHNIIAVGVEDVDICRAVNNIIRGKGGISAVCGDREEFLPLPVGGIMSDLSFGEVAKRYTDLDRFAKALGSQLRAPFMTLSFMALLVIPEIKLGDKGLFDVRRFEFMDLFASR